MLYMKRLPTWRWVVTRLELAVALICLALPLAYFGLIPADLTGHWAALAVIVTGELGMLVGTIWLFRIARGNPEAGASWRFRDH